MAEMKRGAGLGVSATQFCHKDQCFFCQFHQATPALSADGKGALCCLHCYKISLRFNVYCGAPVATAAAAALAQIRVVRGKYTGLEGVALQETSKGAHVQLRHRDSRRSKRVRVWLPRASFTTAAATER